MGKISRRTLLASVLLSNGTPALPLAKLNGIPVAVFSRRIKLGMSPDDAAKIPVDGPARTLGASKALPDDPGEKIGPVAYLDERAGFTMRRISERLRAVVVETAGDERIAVASNGSMYLVQTQDNPPDGRWITTYANVSAYGIAQQVMQSRRLIAVAQGLPDEPAEWLATHRMRGAVKH